MFQAYGEDVKLDDQRLTLNVAWIRKMMDSSNVAGPLESMPWVRFFGNKIYEDLVQSQQARDALFKEQFTRAKVIVSIVLINIQHFIKGWLTHIRKAALYMQTIQIA